MQQHAGMQELVGNSRKCSAMFHQQRQQLRTCQNVGVWGGADSDFNLAAEAPPASLLHRMNGAAVFAANVCSNSTVSTCCEVNTSPTQSPWDSVDIPLSFLCFDVLPPFWRWPSNDIILYVWSNGFYKICLARKWLQNVHVHLYMHEAGWLGCSTSSIFNASRPEMWSELNFWDLIDQPSMGRVLGLFGQIVRFSFPRKFLCFCWMSFAFVSASLATLVFSRKDCCNLS